MMQISCASNGYQLIKSEGQSLRVEV